MLIRGYYHCSGRCSNFHCCRKYSVLRWYDRVSAKRRTSNLNKNDGKAVRLLMTSLRRGAIIYIEHWHTTYQRPGITQNGWYAGVYLEAGGGSSKEFNRISVYHSNSYEVYTIRESRIRNYFAWPLQPHEVSRPFNAVREDAGLSVKRDNIMAISVSEYVRRGNIDYGNGHSKSNQNH